METYADVLRDLANILDKDFNLNKIMVAKRLLKIVVELGLAKTEGGS